MIWKFRMNIDLEYRIIKKKKKCLKIILWLGRHWKIWWTTMELNNNSLKRNFKEKIFYKNITFWLLFYIKFLILFNQSKNTTKNLWNYFLLVLQWILWNLNLKQANWMNKATTFGLRKVQKKLMIWKNFDMKISLRNWQQCNSYYKKLSRQ